MVKSIKQKKIILIGLIIIIIIVGSWRLLAFRDDQSIFQEEIENTKEEFNQSVSLTIDYGQGSIEIFQAEFREGMTIFDLLKEKTQESGLTLKTQNYDIGILIEAIGDKENGQDGKYWLYYINGEMPMVAVDKQEITTGDKIEFKFEEPTF